jgi:hypothetical protein
MRIHVGRGFFNRGSHLLEINPMMLTKKPPKEAMVARRNMIPKINARPIMHQNSDSIFSSKREFHNSILKPPNDLTCLPPGWARRDNK